MGNKVLFAIADAHSFYDEMVAALTKQGFDVDDPLHYVVLCGDMFDRGRKPLETFDFLQSLGDRFLYVRGNHEDLLFNCAKRVEQGGVVTTADIFNGTADTLATLCGMSSSEFDAALDGGAGYKKLMYALKHRVYPILDQIEQKAVDYIEIGDYIFVHGWIPCYHFENADLYVKVTSWRNGDWRDARWFNGPKAWHDGVKEDGKTIVCGHWHTSQANFLYHGVGAAEFGDGADFSPFVDDGIIALDACTSYSGVCNCVRFDDVDF